MPAVQSTPALRIGDFLSQREFHRTTLYVKLNMETRTAAVARALAALHSARAPSPVGAEPS